MKGHSEDITGFVRLPRYSQTSQVLRGVSVAHVFKSICDVKHSSRGLSVSLHKLLYQQTPAFPGAFTLIQRNDLQSFHLTALRRWGFTASTRASTEQFHWSCAHASIRKEIA